MRKQVFLTLAILASALLLLTLRREAKVEAQNKPGAGFAAIPGAKGGQDLFGAYDVVKGWPKYISTIPGNEKWTYGARQGITRKAFRDSNG